jgi:hypothetical protein
MEFVKEFNRRVNLFLLFFYLLEEFDIWSQLHIYLKYNSVGIKNCFMQIFAGMILYALQWATNITSLLWNFKVQTSNLTIAETTKSWLLHEQHSKKIHNGSEYETKTLHPHCCFHYSKIKVKRQKKSLIATNSSCWHSNTNRSISFLSFRWTMFRFIS